ncbi:MAG TPA: hypothetical protein VM822_12350 [Pseudolabrys sp.]|jgi:hypothetical protein|nr:hypothetical protein [Pseudolabrys sp.]
MTKKQVLGFIPLPTSKPTANPRLNHKISPAINFANPSPVDAAEFCRQACTKTRQIAVEMTNKFGPS